MAGEQIEAATFAAPETSTNGLVAESAQDMLRAPSTAEGLITALSATSPQAEHALGQDNPFQLVASPGDSVLPTPSKQDMREAIRSLLSDAMSGDGFSEGSIEAFQRIFREEICTPGATGESVARGLNAMGAAINQAVGPVLANEPDRRAQPIGMAIMKEADGSFSYYMMLNKNDAAFEQNKLDLVTGTPNPNIIKLGPFVPGQAI